ncbi:alpha/beta-hydrolase [Coccomyxa subellipsoidea C-169]|uniref:Alpha/beta-hydrolase n=1 Tax=Coccomyxa subellipsoidea (strain C-169) TaxID=574566 RepID=I0Z1G2_COCSC|nr:alpha/beta-hydrolase [Coccomyxa subellipsoidea C-169]EIE24481.1 alpha/beta-hydrolase [Coccomyxa subellipsoidea C-169]|eukprot:XP_005649025.1 alpha/beta-hydrolase [Coccomyxa subellipsoidea C-169]
MGIVMDAGPYFYKSIQAASFTVAADQDSLNGVPVDKSVQVPMAGGSSLLAAWSRNASALILAFSGTNQTLENVTASNPLQSMSFLGAAFGDNGTIDAQTSDPFKEALAPDSLSSVISNVSSGTWPARIVATGYAQGGGLAKLAAVWAGAAYPGTQIRCIVFGAPRVGDARFLWAYQQLVDLRYEWAVKSDPLPDTPEGSPQSDALYYLGEGTLAGNASLQPPASLTFYMAALEANARNITSQGSLADDNAQNTVSPGNSTQPGTPVVTQSPSPAPTGFFGRVKQTFENVVSGVEEILPVATQEIARSSTDNTEVKEFPFTNLSDSDPNACPVELCKTRQPSVWSCNVYKNGPDTIAPGSVTINEPEKSTDLAVAWLPQNSTAVYAWRGSVDRKDWLANFHLMLENDPLSPVLDQLFPGATAHSGFVGQFRAVTDQATNDTYNIKTVLLKQSKGRPPTKVICTGHSLGAALASLCGVWASLQWLDADVRVVTFGSPAVGNQEFANAFKLAVGREYRLVDRLDVVPALPPFDGYVHLDYSQWILDNGTIVAETRPHYNTRDLNWDDHACAAYSNATYNVTHVSAPQTVTGTAPI